MIPRGGGPPTATGLPARLGSFTTAAEANMASTSPKRIWRDQRIIKHRHRSKVIRQSQRRSGLAFLGLAGYGKAMHARSHFTDFTSATTGKNYAGCSKRPFSKTAASEDRRRT